MKNYEPTLRQSTAIREFVSEAITPLIEDVLVKKLGQAMAFLKEQEKQEPAEYKEECWACGCEECICATKVPGYYESKIKEAVLAEREACAKVCDDWSEAAGVHLAATIRARGEK